MTVTSKTIIFFGNERLTSGLTSTDTPVLRGLIKQGYTIAAIVSHYTESHSRNNRPLEVARIAKEHNIPIFLPDKPAEIADKLKRYNAEAAVLVAYGRLIPQSVIDIFPKGIINVHPSLLPRYRGPTPIEMAIRNGDKKTGISVMKLTAGMDEGPVFSQITVLLQGTETKFDLYNLLAQKGAKLLLNSLPHILDGSLKAKPQDDSYATYCSLLEKKDGQLDLSKLTAQEAERTVRAYLGFPKTKLTFGKHTIIVTKAHVSKKQKTPLDFLCQDNAYLSVDELVAPSGRTMAAEAFLQGYAA
jgi:methionyl-tRNA formyltransferase